MKKIILILIVLCICQIGGFSKTTVLPDLTFPQLIKADSERIYIVEKEKIHIYSLKPFKKIRTFGKLGEGPKEFRVHPVTPIMLSLVKNKLIVATGGSIYYYDRKGEYIKEKKIYVQTYKKYKKLKLSSDYKNKIIKHYKTDPFLKQFYNMLSPISFPAYFPAIRDMRVSDKKIYGFNFSI